MAIRLIALDIDGTLLDSQGHIPSDNLRAITEARARGIEMALVTGRRYDFARTIADRIDQEFVMIVSNGALIRAKSGQTHVRRLLSREIALEVLAATPEFREGASVVFDRPRENQVIYESVFFTNAARQKYYDANRDFISAISPLEDCLNEDPIQLVFTGPVATMRRIVERLRADELPTSHAHGQRPEPPKHPIIKGTNTAGVARFEIAVTEYESRDFTIVDVLREGCTKGRALAEWARHRGIAREEVMAVGDNWNDREMLAFAGLPIVMGNAAAALKSMGWRVTLSNDECGVAAAIREFALGE